MADDCVDEVKVFRKEETDDPIDGSEQLNSDKHDIAFEAEVETASAFGTPLPNQLTTNLTSDDCVDEVKVFRKEETDDPIDGSEQLNSDKHDIAFEAEVETASAFGTPLPNQLTTNLTSGLSNMLLSSPYISPYYMSPAYQAAVLINAQQRFAALTQMHQSSMNMFQPSSSGLQSITNPPTPKSNIGPMKTPKSKENKSRGDAKARVHIKKPLNAFMIFMKENRPKLLEQEGNLTKQSAELNSDLGKMWQKLSEAEQKQYFEKAKILKEEHERLYPGWSARDNYAIHKKQRLQKKNAQNNGSDGSEAKKCRARFGIDNKESWCKHCMRKKRCLLVYGDGENSSSCSEGSPSTPGSTDLPEIPNPNMPQSFDPQRGMPQFFPGNGMNFCMPMPFFNPFPFGMPPPPPTTQIIHPSSLIPPKAEPSSDCPESSGSPA
uniref:HMG box domain-containing protein n=1 Tax=Panagrolaimus sp. JU765 TaxID=591449 RepID=A0AC34R2A5_9BILA